ncbi:MAG: sugar phosphate isomerase/epimerase, partial [Clostridia bacterium]|nr:sugar phosphate isomerase/epimerase [Clostridia bacterium]
GKAAVDYLNTIGVEYAAIPWYDKKEFHTNWDETVKKFAEVSKLLADGGIQLMYHNHDFEFEKIDGEYILDKLYATLDAKTLMPEIDTCWAAVGHGDVADLLRRYDGRCPVIHLKDMYCRGKYGFQNTNGERPADCAVRPVGYGRLDMIDILHTAEEIGTKWIIIEQDSPSFGLDRLECAALCRDWLRMQGR